MPYVTVRKEKKQKFYHDSQCWGGLSYSAWPINKVQKQFPVVHLTFDEDGFLADKLSDVKDIAAVEHLPGCAVGLLWPWQLVKLHVHTPP